MHVIQPIVLITMLLISVGCASHPRREASSTVTDPITHVVVCWLKTPGDAEQAWRIIETSQSFAKLPGVRNVRVGERLHLATPRPVDETTFDIALVMTFDSPEALRVYQASPEHEEAVRAVLRPMTSRIVIYDFVAKTAR